MNSNRKKKHPQATTVFQQASTDITLSRIYQLAPEKMPGPQKDFHLPTTAFAVRFRERKRHHIFRSFPHGKYQSIVVISIKMVDVSNSCCPNNHRLDGAKTRWFVMVDSNYQPQTGADFRRISERTIINSMDGAKLAQQICSANQVAQWCEES